MQNTLAGSGPQAAPGLIEAEYGPGSVPEYLQPPAPPPAAPAPPDPVSGPAQGSFTPSVYNLATSPQVLLAMHQQGTEMGALQQWLNLSLGGISSGGDQGMAQAEIAYQQQQAQRALAMAAHQHDLRKKAIVNRLAARGILRSGELPYQESEEAFNYGFTTEGIELALQHAVTMAQKQQAQQAAAAASQRANVQAEFAMRKAGIQNAPLQAYLEAYNFAIANPHLFSGVSGLPPQFAGAMTTFPAVPAAA